MSKRFNDCTRLNSGIVYNYNREYPYAVQEKDPFELFFSQKVRSSDGNRDILFKIYIPINWLQILTQEILQMVMPSLKREEKLNADICHLQAKIVALETQLLAPTANLEGDNPKSSTAPQEYSIDEMGINSLRNNSRTVINNLSSTTCEVEDDADTIPDADNYNRSDAEFNQTKNYNDKEPLQKTSKDSTQSESELPRSKDDQLRRFMIGVAAWFVKDELTANNFVATCLPGDVTASSPTLKEAIWFPSSYLYGLFCVWLHPKDPLKSEEWIGIAEFSKRVRLFYGKNSKKIGKWFPTHHGAAILPIVVQKWIEENLQHDYSLSINCVQLLNSALKVKFNNPKIKLDEIAFKQSVKSSLKKITPLKNA